MIENQKTINEWADKEFGDITLDTAIERMVKEVIELEDIDLDNTNSPEQVSDECADILITLYRIVGCAGFDLHACVDHKMEINRGRKWKSNGDGTGQHIKEA